MNRPPPLFALVLLWPLGCGGSATGGDDGPGVARDAAPALEAPAPLEATVPLEAAPLEAAEPEGGELEASDDGGEAAACLPLGASCAEGGACCGALVCAASFSHPEAPSCVTGQ